MAVFQRRLLYIATDGKNRTSDLGEERGQSEKCLQSCQYRTYTDRYLRHGQNISIYKNGQDSYLFTLLRSIKKRLGRKCGTRLYSLVQSSVVLSCVGGGSSSG